MEGLMSTATTDLTTLTPVEIDTELARLWGETQKYEGWLASLERHIAKGWSNPGREADDRAQAEKYRLTIAGLRDEARPFEGEYTHRGGWLRYFLVTNGNGHVHRGMHCSTCYPTTTYAWLIDLADCDEAAMVAEWGEKACTVCFPSAPTMRGFGDGTSAYARRTAAEKAAVAADKAAKAVAKAAKALNAPVETRFSTVCTVAAAKAEIRRAVEANVWYGEANGAERLADIANLTAALLDKGIPAEEIETIKAKAAAKARKELGS